MGDQRVSTARVSTAAATKRTPDLRERRRQDTRLEISRAALELFERQGSASTTVDEIARDAGVSPSTFFRCFPTKEESVIETDFEFERELDEWLESASPADITLSGIETIFERSITRLSAASNEARDRLLRTRRLIGSDAHLRAAAFAAESKTFCRITDRVAATLGGSEARSVARLLVESACMTTRIAFDDWAERIDNGEHADVVEIYRTTLRDLRRVVGA